MHLTKRLDAKKPRNGQEAFAIVRLNWRGEALSILPGTPTEEGFRLVQLFVRRFAPTPPTRGRRLQLVQREAA